MAKDDIGGVTESSCVRGRVVAGVLCLASVLGRIPVRKAKGIQHPRLHNPNRAPLFRTGPAAHYGDLQLR